MLKSCFFILSSLCLLGLGHHALALDAASFDRNVFSYVRPIIQF